jgi:hypothetical protein
VNKRRFAPPNGSQDRKLDQYLARLQRVRDAYRERREAGLKPVEHK